MVICSCLFVYLHYYNFIIIIYLTCTCILHNYNIIYYLYYSIFTYISLHKPKLARMVSIVDMGDDSSECTISEAFHGRK